MSDRSLFEEMTAAADALRATVDRLNRYDLQIEFRQIIRARRRDLSREEWLAMFEIWIEGVCREMRASARGCDRRRDRDHRRLRARQCAGGSVRVPVRRGARESTDPAVMAVHQPHYLAAKAAAVLCQEGARASCCARDEGCGPFGANL
jgi:hypothetical protein